MKNLLFTLFMALGLAGAAAASGTDGGEQGGGRRGKEKQEKAYVEAALALVYVAPKEGQGQETSLTRYFRQAACTRGGMRRSLFFSADNARMLARIELVEPGELSAKLTRKLKKKYKGYRIGQVIRYSDGETLYFVSLQKDQEQVWVLDARY